ncbi:MAG: hypothetical protein ACYCPQ_05950 [Elusimicrobiota bacterium]
MRSIFDGLRRGVADIFDSDDDPAEPFYDPIHLAAVLIVVMVLFGVLYWLLWTILVYEGGIFLKIQSAWLVLFGGKTLSDLGYHGYYDSGAFRGWIGSAAAAIIFFLCVAAIYALDKDFGRRRGEKIGR